MLTLGENIAAGELIPTLPENITTYYTLYRESVPSAFIVNVGDDVADLNTEKVSAAVAKQPGWCVYTGSCKTRGKWLFFLVLHREDIPQSELARLRIGE